MPSSDDDEAPALRLLDSKEFGRMQNPSRPPIGNGTASNIVADSVETVQSIKLQPHLSKRHAIELDEYTMRSGSTCILKIWPLPREDVLTMKLPCEFKSVLQAVKLLLQPGAFDYPRLLKQSVLDGGALGARTSWNQDQPAGPDWLERKVQRTERWSTNGPRSGIPCIVPVFCTAEIRLDVSVGTSSVADECGTTKTTSRPLQVLNEFIIKCFEPDYMDVNDPTSPSITIVASTDPSQIASDAIRRPLHEVPANPFKDIGADLDSINQFVKNNFPGHGLAFNHFIVLDELSFSSLPRTCIVADNTGSIYASDGLCLVRSLVEWSPFEEVLALQVGEVTIDDHVWGATSCSLGTDL